MIRIEEMLTIASAQARKASGYATMAAVDYDDFYQEAMIRMLRVAGEVEVAPGATFAERVAYMRRAARSACIDCIRRAQLVRGRKARDARVVRLETVALDADDPQAGIEPRDTETPLDVLLMTERLDAATDAVIEAEARMTPAEREVFRADLAGTPQSQSRTPRTTFNLHYRARRKVADCLSARGLEA